MMYLISIQTNINYSYRLNVNNQVMYNSWMTAIATINQQNVLGHPKQIFICSKHFKYDCFQILSGNLVHRRLNNNAVPSIFPNSKDM